MAEALLVILRSADGVDDWQPVKPDAVPDWVKDPDCISRLVAGDMARGPAEGVAVPEEKRPWYRAVRIDTAAMEGQQTLQ